MSVKVTMIFQATTEPVNPMVATAHTGGWSESVWTGGFVYVPRADLDALMTARRPLLPKQAHIVGLRQGIYQISENRLLPLGTNGFKVNLPGSASTNLNLPQDSLELSGTSQSSINTNRFRLGALPDEMVERGEYSPTTVYTYYVQQYCALLALGVNAWSFLGRVLSNPSARVMAIVPGLASSAVITLSAPLILVPGTSYLRLNRVYDSVNEPVKGTFLVTAFTAPSSYTVTGFSGQTVNAPSGTARLDQISLFKYGTVQPSRAVVKKIGRPSQSYRGRQSKRTIA